MINNIAESWIILYIKNPKPLKYRGETFFLVQVLSFKILENKKMTSVAHKLSPQSTSSSMIDLL
jgi:hypothetical protein